MEMERASSCSNYCLYSGRLRKHSISIEELLPFVLFIVDLPVMVFWVSLRFIFFSLSLVSGSRLSSGCASCKSTYKMEYALKLSDLTILKRISLTEGTAERKSSELQLLAGITSLSQSSDRKTESGP